MTNSIYPDRKRIRLKNYDYSNEGLYFITLCTIDRKNLLGHIEKGEMRLNTLGKIAAEEWEKTSEIRKNSSFGEYIFMPNHFHCILSIHYKISTERDENISNFKTDTE